MTEQTPIKLEFEFTSLPHPEGSDNKTTLSIIPKGELSDTFELSVGTGYDLDNTLKFMAPRLAETVTKYSDRPLGNQVTFTDADNKDYKFVVDL